MTNSDIVIEAVKRLTEKQLYPDGCDCETCKMLEKGEISLQFTDPSSKQKILLSINVKKLGNQNDQTIN